MYTLTGALAVASQLLHRQPRQPLLRLGQEGVLTVEP